MTEPKTTYSIPKLTEIRNAQAIEKLLRFCVEILSGYGFTVTPPPGPSDEAKAEALELWKEHHP